MVSDNEVVAEMDSTLCGSCLYYTCEDFYKARKCTLDKHVQCGCKYYKLKPFMVEEVPIVESKIKQDVSLRLYDTIIGKARKIFLTRGAQYNKNDVDLFDYFPDEVSWNQIFHMKVLREKAQLGRDFAGRNKDSLIDLINYAIYKYAWLEKKAREEE